VPELSHLHETAVIAGGGQAAGEVAFQLRQNGYAGRIVLIGKESHLPYSRPPLSKAFLTGEIELDQMLTKSATAYEKANIEVSAGSGVHRIERDRGRVVLENGGWVQYDTLVIATGGRPRQLAVPGHELSKIFYLRSVDDARAIKTALRPGARLIIVGAGFVGLEVAAIAVKIGLDVTVLESAPRVLERVAAPVVSTFYQRIHSEHGVKIRTNSKIVRYQQAEADPKSVGGVEIDSEEVIPADFVVVGVGLVPNVELAADAGLEIDNGIVVDQNCRTSDPQIYAIGDCTTHAIHGFVGRKLRLESVPNVLEQARICAAAICGRSPPRVNVPFFWSDQYKIKLQIAGISQGHDEIVVRGDPNAGSFAVFYLADGVTIAVEAVNAASDFLAAGRLIAERRVVPSKRLADNSIPLKALLKTADSER
jgi:3-phenylpropionate/trans-cinnamate dioxygenase ferredoxin reductase component